MPRSYVPFLLLLMTLISCGDPTPPSAPVPEVDASEEHIRISIDGKPVLEYQIAEQLPDGLPEHYRRGGFIHPVYSPQGRVVTDDFPAGHAHQHGVFTAWTKTTFRGELLDFWNQQKDQGTVYHREVLETFAEDSVAGFSVRLEQVSLEHGPVLEDIWHVRVHNTADPFVWDLRSEQTNISDDTLFLEQHVYGGLGVRGSAQWNEADSVAYRTAADVLTDIHDTRVPANHTRPEFVAMFGLVEGENSSGISGLATLSHPENFRAPQFVRVHPEMPYYSVTPVVEEGFFIAPGERYLSRYRFVVFDGAPTEEQILSHGW